MVLVICENNLEFLLNKIVCEVFIFFFNFICLYMFSIVMICCNIFELI